MSGSQGSNPNIAQGTLNRIRASVIWPSFSGLNVSAPYLGKRGITLNFVGEDTVYIDTMTGAVTSPEPYVRLNFAIHLLKTQALANSYKLQRELNTLMQPWNAYNCSLTGVENMDFSGADAGYVVRAGGIYYINSVLFL
jgi:hypothetical protein